MDKPIVVWCVIAGVLLFAFVFKAVRNHQEEYCRKGRKRKPLFGLAKERELFFIPGDVDDDEFDEL